jgi:uroporphyrinogen III methyltransferase/synthase
LPNELRNAGADVIAVTAYRTVPVSASSGVDIYKLLLDQGVDVVTFTSASTVRNFVTLLGAEAAADLLGTTLVASIGPVTAEAARQLGIETSIMPSTYTVPCLAKAIADHFQRAEDAAGG